MHLAMRVAISALSTEKCNQLGGPYVDWQCKTCLALNEAGDDICELCGSEKDISSDTVSL